MISSAAVPESDALSIGADVSMQGRTGSYDKRLRDMGNVYRDSAAFEAAVVEHGEDFWSIGCNNIAPSPGLERSSSAPAHCYPVATRCSRVELYQCLSGHGIMLLETVDGRSLAVPLTACEAVHLPGYWVHRSVNVGDDPFVTLFCYAADAGQNYASSRTRAHGATRGR